MVDLKGQYYRIKNEIDSAIADVIDSSAFINGPQVKEFADNLSRFQGSKYVIPCANGTDALQIALMSLNFKPGDEIIVPAFTYVATAEVIGLLGLTPVMIDVDKKTFNIDVNEIEKAVTPKTKAIVPVHLYGQSCDMEPLLNIAKKYNLYVIEDNAQAIGAEYISTNGIRSKTGTMGDFGCTSFFPSKNLGCYGDGGALTTDNAEFAERAEMIANHGQKRKYYHSVIGCNSRLDSIQAAVLNVKLKRLGEYVKARYDAAQYYTAALKNIDGIICPFEAPYSMHVYHQYTIIVKNGRRDELKMRLDEAGIPSMIYYPLPLQKQEAFASIARSVGSLNNAAELSASVLSLPMHTELTHEIMDEVIDGIMACIK